MANPRRPSLQSSPHSPNPSLLPLSVSDHPQTSSSLFTSISLFLKRPQAFPYLLSIFVLLTWLSLRFQRPPSPPHYSPQLQEPKSDTKLDVDANLVRFNGVDVPSAIAKDKRGWLVDPVSLALKNGIHGGAQFCASVHMGEIRPGEMRGNHRHHTCNETFIIWGAATKFRLENANLEGKDYAEVSIGADEVAVAASPAGTAHALINVDQDFDPTIGAFPSIYEFKVQTPGDSLVAHFEYHKHPITSIEWSSHEPSTLAVSSADSQLTIWDLSLERGEEEETEFKAKMKEQVNAPEDLSSQLLFVHQGQKDLKELHRHPQIPGMIISTAADGFNVLMPANVETTLPSAAP